MVKHPVTHTIPIASTFPNLDVTGTEQPVQSSDDLLPREPCLQALAALRHAKWFQVCVSNLNVFNLQKSKINLKENFAGNKVRL